MISAINCSTCDTPPKMIEKIIEGIPAYRYECPNCKKISSYATTKDYACIFWNQNQIRGISK